MSNDDVSTLARIVTGLDIAQREYKYILDGYAREQDAFFKEMEEKFGIDTSKYDTDFRSFMKNGKVYAIPKDKVKVESKGEEENPNKK